MLFLLTGDIQTGKTRWLEELIAQVQDCGIEVAGVVAPGRWNGREKLGIDNVLIPGNERIAFAYRSDLAPRTSAETFDQARNAGIRWFISDTALERVNAHFAHIKATTPCDNTPRLLIVDELGQLELVAEKGLSEALHLVERGPAGQFDHAIVVVRESLIELAQERFTTALWNGITCIHPGESEREAVVAAFAK